MVVRGAGAGAGVGAGIVGIAIVGSDGTVIGADEGNAEGIDGMSGSAATEVGAGAASAWDGAAAVMRWMTGACATRVPLFATSCSIACATIELTSDTVSSAYAFSDAAVAGAYFSLSTA